MTYNIAAVGKCTGRGQGQKATVRYPGEGPWRLGDTWARLSQGSSLRPSQGRTGRLPSWQRHWAGGIQFGRGSHAHFDDGHSTPGGGVCLRPRGHSRAPPRTPGSAPLTLAVRTARRLPCPSQPGSAADAHLAHSCPRGPAAGLGESVPGV